MLDCLTIVHHRKWFSRMTLYLCYLRESLWISPRSPFPFIHWYAQQIKKLYRASLFFKVFPDPDKRSALYLLGISASGEQELCSTVRLLLLFSRQQHLDVICLWLFALKYKSLCSTIDVLWYQVVILCSYCVVKCVYCVCVSTECWNLPHQGISHYM